MAITKIPVTNNSWPAGPLLSGPMLGEVGEHDALVWAQARDTSPLTLNLYAPGAQPVLLIATPAAADGLCVVFHVTGLVPGTQYEYDLSSQHGATPHYHLEAGLAKNVTRARIAFGSCFRQWTDNGLTIFDAIGKEADLFLMTGDNCYYPKVQQDENADMLDQLNHRNNGALRKLTPNVSVLGIWDDHDFGPNDANSTYPGKPDSLSAFKHVWAQRKYGLPGVAGIFSSVRCGPVEVFLLDGRYYRVKGEKGKKDRILGDQQLAWLKTQLQNSTAPVKLIVSGSVVLPEFVRTIKDPGSDWEGWRTGAPDELDALLSHIEAHDIQGVVFASGDLHLGYLMHRSGTRLANGKRGPEYWEVVASPLANTIWSWRVKVGPNPPTYDPWLLEEVTSTNYGLLDVDLGRTGKEIVLSLKNGLGATSATRSVALASLRVRPALEKLSVVVWPNGKAYFFKGNRYVRYQIVPYEGVELGPNPIAGNWPGLAEAFPDGIDAAVVWSQDKAYFFKGNGYVRYTVDPATEGVDAGYPRYVSLNWKGLWSDGIDAAVVWPNGKAYFFKGDQYVRYNMDPQNEGVEPGYPKPIKGHWKGLAEAFPDGIDAAVVWPLYGKAYFFKGDRYVRYTTDPANEGVDAGYPKPIQGNWPGLDSL